MKKCNMGYGNEEFNQINEDQKSLFASKIDLLEKECSKQIKELWDNKKYNLKVIEETEAIRKKFAKKMEEEKIKNEKIKEIRNNSKFADHKLSEENKASILKFIQHPIMTPVMKALVSNKKPRSDKRQQNKKGKNLKQNMKNLKLSDQK
ncbi:hypothetical protein Mgra_00008082 [Meloidogyne graminicola]|uniref:Uncharacterized protein n=1 Tax=Meloidogyne graminicola TaxID=189291 RepID=A0A8S9ZGP7_9BILA|nr:hypothetical protein Mgra_00008082 [Meloidogyne graminicola]